MNNLTVSVKHVAAEKDLPCSVCGALFVPAEDSGSKVFSMKAPDQEPFAALLCGGCYSKWSHGTPLTLKGPLGH